ncbi:MAG: putative pyruvate dehydrogenase (acetyl-transferring) beta subunit [Polyangiaceae bacterium]|jgi:2-oxoisovalerate dehydrogenase E1 component|nr:putative pyruvate dehydrogenase (acetyl-transferring) beta subunit [Polyangiaceae bacterium]
MSIERLNGLLARLRERLVSTPAGSKASRFEPSLGRELLESMLLARHLDIAALELRARGAGHYTIGSAGHESNVVLGRLTRVTDPTIVHYRSAALQLERSRQVAERDGVRDIALSLVAASEEPVSGGRHKLFGGTALGIIPQTSTIASHLPRAVGLAYALGWKRQRSLAQEPTDAVVVCSFGDASVNHSTALGAFNAAGWVAHQSLPLPLLFVCEDNGLGVSVRSPPGWTRARLEALPHLRYFSADGSDLEACYDVAEAALTHCRATRRPAVLHLSCVRLGGHAGSDVDTTYRSRPELEAAAERDPVWCAARDLVAHGVMSAAEVLELDRAAQARVTAEAERAADRPRLTTRAQVAQSLARPIPPGFAAKARTADAAEPMTLAQGVGYALKEILHSDPGALLFGEDVARKGGVYGATKGLLDRFGHARVFNTLLDEQTILGLSLGAATLGLYPLPEIQYLAYLHNAEDQLRGEAATFSFFSNGELKNPMLVRIAGLAYQKGFGGHFHNDNSLAVLRDIPGISVCVPARADDAVALYRTAHALGRLHGHVVVAVEPIALYHRKDLVSEGDGQWLAAAPKAGAEYGRGRLYAAPEPRLSFVTYGNGVAMCLRAKSALGTAGIQAEVLDLRWLAPLPWEDVLRAAKASGRVLVVDESRHSGNVSEALLAGLYERAPGVKAARVTAADCFIPLGDAAELVLVSQAEIVEAALKLSRS